MNLTRPFASLALLAAAAQATAAESDAASSWTRDPALVPWETLAAAGDGDREPARNLRDIEHRRQHAKRELDRAQAAPDRARTLAEVGDLFRDEARLLLEQDARDPWRIPLETSPAWLQLEIAARWYAEALLLDPKAVDATGRLTLLLAVISSRVGRGERFDDYVRVIRSYRGTPFVEMAKLAVGDHHVKAGDLSRAQTAYKMVRENRDPELAYYARYRLASLHAIQGDHAKAQRILTEILDLRDEAPLVALLQDAARSALANHLARELPLDELVSWMDDACDDADHACWREVRRAASDTCRRMRDDRCAAWLSTVDSADSLKGHGALRAALAHALQTEAGSRHLVKLAESSCPDADAWCHIDRARAIASFYEQTEDPEGSWLPDYLTEQRCRWVPAACPTTRPPSPPTRSERASPLDDGHPQTRDPRSSP